MKRVVYRGRLNINGILYSDAAVDMEECSQRGEGNETSVISAGTNLNLHYSRRAPEGNIVEKEDNTMKV